MKKLILSIGLISSIFLGLNAQVKEGFINYSIEFEGLPAEQAAMMKGMEMKSYYKNGKSRMDQSMAFGTSTTITDENGNTTILSDMMGMKKYGNMTAKDAEKLKKNKKSEDPKITYLNDTKTIAGYDCKKANVEIKTNEGETSNTEVWYCEKLDFPKTGRNEEQFKGLKGTPLEFSMSLPQGFKMVMKATEVSTAPVSNSKFEVSTDGYTKMSPEEMKQMGGGQ